MFEIQYAFLGISKEKKFNCVNWLMQFESEMSKRLNVTCDFSEAQNTEVVEQTLSQSSHLSMLYSYGTWCRVVGKNINLKFIVFCNEMHQVSKNMKESNKNAILGACADHQLAAIYHYEKNVVWHELLHLCGADDCYDTENPDDTAPLKCGTDDCIMRYDATKSATNSTSFHLCDKNIKNIQDHYKTIQK